MATPSYGAKNVLNFYCGIRLLNNGGISGKRIYRKNQDKPFSINLDVILMDIETTNQSEIVDITAGVERHVRESGIANGICLVFSLHTTTALIINEADNALLKDILELMERIVPPGAGYGHDRGDGNAHSHLRAALLGSSIVIPVERSRLALGTWQRVLFIELDGPRKRRISLRLIRD